MKEDSIEEALKKLSTGKKIKMYELLRTFKKEGIENFVITRKKYVDVILSDYKRVLKENEELKETYKSEKKMKNEYVKLYQDLLLKENIIPVQKVKDQIEEYKNMLKTCNKAKDIFSDIKDNCKIGWSFIKKLASDGGNKLKDWYEIYSGKR